MRRLIIILIALVSCTISLSAQGEIAQNDLKRLQNFEDSLATYAYAVLNDTLPERRFYSCKQMIIGLKNALQTRNSFQYKFTKLPSISIQYPQDSTFRIFTWQLYVDKDDYRYYGAIQIKGEALQLIPLIDRSYNVVDIEQSTLEANEWYGAVYYNLKEVGKGKDKYYLLFGFDGFEFFKKRKVIDVLKFVQGKPVFGAPVFVKQDPNGLERTKNRLFMEYSAEVSTRMNFDSNLDMIIHDHLIEIQGKYGEGVTYVPDGSYEGYKQEKGKWLHIDKVFDQVSDEPPRPFPVLEQKGKKDILGNPKKKN